MLDAFLEDFESIQSGLKALPDEDQQLIIEHFNQVNEDYDTFGDCLFGDKDDFELIINNLSKTEKEKFVSELVNIEIIDKEAFS